MKKILSCFVALFAAVSLYATDLNIYASGLNATRSAGVTTVEYTLNAQATAVNVKLYNGSLTPVKVIAVSDAAKLTKGTHSVVLDLSDVADGSYTWAIEAVAEANEALTLVPAEAGYTYAKPRGLDVDKDPESPSFGNIYIADAIGTEASGLVAFYPATMSSRTTITTSGWSASPASPMRVTVGEDHLLYITDWSDNSPNVHIVDPQAPTAGNTLVFGGTNTGSGGVFVDGEGHSIHGSISHCYVTGAGSTRVLYTFDEDMSPVSMYSYNIGELNSLWTSVPSSLAFDNADNYMQNGNSQIWPDGKNGWWISQHRATDQDAIPMLIHVNSSGSVDFHSGPSTLRMDGGAAETAYNRGAFGLNREKTQMAFARKGNVDVWNISWEGDVPSLSLAYTISTIADAQTYNVAFDYAGNIYVTYDGYDIYAYAPAKATNSCETPARSANTIEVGAEDIHVTSVTLDPTASIEVGHNLALVATIVPSDATDKSLSWESSNPSIATVSTTGLVSAVAEGNTTITVTTTDGGHTATCDVTVWQTHVTSVTVEPNEIALGVGFKQQLTATILPADATNKTYTWSSDDESIATVANGMVTAVAVGSTTIKATAEDGGIVGSCNVVVSPAVAHISAYDLALIPTATGFKFSFKTNTSGGGAIVFYDKSTGDYVGEKALPYVVQGQNNLSVNLDELPGNGQDLTWGVRLVGADNAAFSKIYESATTSGRAHLVVDASPESPYMGQIYYSLRTGSATGGLYVFDQNYTRSEKYDLGQGKTGYMHPSIDETGKVWLSDWTDQDHSGIWIVDPSDLTTCTQVFQGTRQSSGLFKNGDVEVGGSSPACFVYGKGDDRKLFTIQEDFTTVSSKQPMAIYNIGSAYTWDAAPTAIYPIASDNNNFSNSLFVVEQGYWVSKNRGLGSNTASYPALEFYNMNGTRIYNSSADENINGCLGSGFTIDVAHNKLYMIDASYYILEFDVEYAPETNVPTLTFVNKHYTGVGAISSMSMDYAGNLYVAATTSTATTSIGNSTEMRMVVYSPSTHGNNITIVPARSASIIRNVEQLYVFDDQIQWAMNTGREMTKIATNVFRCEIELSADKYVTFSTNQGNDATDWATVNAGRIGAVSEGNYWLNSDHMEGNLVEGLGENSRNFYVPDGRAGKYSFTIDLNTMKFTVARVPKVELMASWNNWQPVEMTSNLGDTTCSCTVSVPAGKYEGDAAGFKVRINNNNTWFGANDTIKRANGVAYRTKILTDAAHNCGLWADLDTADYTFTFHYSDSAMTVGFPISIIRHFEHAGDYQTLAVPFTASIRRINNEAPATVYQVGVNSVHGDYITLTETSYNQMEAGNSYLLKSNIAGDIEIYQPGGASMTKIYEPGQDRTGLYGTIFEPIVYNHDGTGFREGYANNSDWSFYVLQDDNQFHLVSTGSTATIMPTRAYLHVKGVPAQSGAPSIIRIGEENGEATVIQSIEAQDQVVKFIQNGQIYILKDGVVYDVMGRLIR